MKKRIFYGSLVAVAFLVSLYFVKTIIANIIISALSVMALYEIICATKSNVNKSLTIISMAFCGLIPFSSQYLSEYFNFIFYLYILSIVFLFFIDYINIKLDRICLIFVFSIIIPMSFCFLINISKTYDIHSQFYIFLAIAAASITDSCAYFTGRFFGKTKLAEKISPNKTVEGAVGGIIGCVLTFILSGYIYKTICLFYGVNITINLLHLVLIGFLSSVVAIIGDLLASIIKRQYNVKDFGSLIPGHGGILDRLDSVMMVIPFFYVSLNYLTIIAK